MAETLLSPGVLTRENDQSQVTSGPITVGAAVAASNTQANLTQALDFTYLGIKMVLCPGMLGLSTIVASPRSNFIYAFDAEGDGKALQHTLYHNSQDS